MNWCKDKLSEIYMQNYSVMSLSSNNFSNFAIRSRHVHTECACKNLRTTKS